jgi:cytochrome c5
MNPFKVALIAAAAVTGGILTAGAVIAQPSALPDGPGKEIIESTCTACHGADLIYGQLRTPDEWGQVVDRMVGNGASMSDDQYKTVLTYLSTQLAKPADGAASAGH